MRVEIADEAAAFRSAQEALESHRKRLADLFKKARTQNIGPAEIERLTGHLYTKEHISRITTGKA